MIDMDTRIKFRYSGPVRQFKKLVVSDWKAETLASSIFEAKRNFEYQAKRTLNLLPTASVDIDRNFIHMCS